MLLVFTGVYTLPIGICIYPLYSFACWIESKEDNPCVTRIYRCVHVTRRYLYLPVVLVCMLDCEQGG